MGITCLSLSSQTTVSLFSHSMEGDVSNSSNIEGGSVEDLTMLDVDSGISISIDCFKNVNNDAGMSAETVRLGDVGADSVPINVVSESNSLVQESNCARYMFDYMPLWGHSSICGRRSEMEDSFAVSLQFSKIPLRILTNQPVMVTDGLSSTSSIHLTCHFFGVYDGHGGFQVADYCRERVHLALVDEMENLKEDIEGSSEDNCFKQLERVFINCFQKVDNEVAGATASTDSDSKEPIAPETVGSTAVVAILCSSHIIVSNCGDSRAVLCRGKEALALSVDHKPNREDERARIEADGGKVIQWNGYRVLGVLAMSRAIGDRYLKPWVIPKPEVTCVPRMKEDECLIIASDGLWDVMTNEEVCNAARRRILHWHKNNGTTPSTSENEEVCADPAAQAAAIYLSKLALQKGSNDNITVIVVDLKAQRKFKNRR